MKKILSFLFASCIGASILMSCHTATHAPVSGTTTFKLPDGTVVVLSDNANPGVARLDSGDVGLIARAKQGTIAKPMEEKWHVATVEEDPDLDYVKALVVKKTPPATKIPVMNFMLQKDGIVVRAVGSNGLSSGNAVTMVKKKTGAISSFESDFSWHMAQGNEHGDSWLYQKAIVTM